MNRRRSHYTSFHLRVGCHDDRSGFFGQSWARCRRSGRGGTFGTGRTLGRGNYADPRQSGHLPPGPRFARPQGRRLGRQDLLQSVLENSTRTKTSFALAARRLGADTIDFSASSSSLSKGETFIDTAKNIEAMGVDVMIVRHQTPGSPHLLSQNLRCSVINAGDGATSIPLKGYWTS